jgi:coproporphyrinogen III oxidase
MQNLAFMQQQAQAWFRALRDRICAELEAIEREKRSEARFIREAWSRPEGGGGEMSLLRGEVFEKAGVNISTVHGVFSETMRQEVPGAKEKPHFWASGISLVIHPRSPHMPAVHMNTRMLLLRATEEEADAEGIPHYWFGGGADLTPILPNEADSASFHEAFRTCCDRFSPDFYPRYSKWCDEYFFLKHRNEPRGAGGIFYDYLASDDWEEDFAFTRAVGETFQSIYPAIARGHLDTPWTPEERAWQLMRRGRYVEFNLLYDRGTRFGLMTGGHTEAILMSLPPLVTWP